MTIHDQQSTTHELPVNNAAIAKLFDELGDLLEIQGETVFRVRAYRNGSRTLQGLTEPVADILADPNGDLEDLPGIGKELAKKIKVIVETGSLPQLDAAREEIPAGVQAMLRIPGLGPKKVAAIFRELEVESLDALKAAAEAGKVAELSGFGKKTEAKILDHIDDAARADERYSIAVAMEESDILRQSLSEVDGVRAVEVAGSCRRRQETVGDLDLLVIAETSTAVMDRLADHQLVTETLLRGDTKQRVRLRSGLEMDVRVVPEESFGAALQYFTGSKEHNIAIRQRAIDRGYSLSEYGLFDDEKNRVAGRTEEEVYAALDLTWIPPELRENRGEIKKAERAELPKLLTFDDIRGDLHMHTTASDGTASIEEMAIAAQDRGLEYIAITDHSQRVSMANGLSPERVRAHAEEIRRVNETLDGIELFAGIECDILEDATLDLPDDVLAELDWVIAVLHYGLTQPGEQIMRRLRTAIENPHVHAIGHPTGRYVLRRREAEINWPEFYEASADHGVFLEINAHPARLDLDDIHAAAARDHGIPIVINTDAHSIEGFDKLRYGVNQARRAGLEAADVMNTLPLEEFRKRLRSG